MTMTMSAGSHCGVAIAMAAMVFTGHSRVRWLWPQLHPPS
jgi:hypothetical protein